MACSGHSSNSSPSIRMSERGARPASCQQPTQPLLSSARRQAATQYDLITFLDSNQPVSGSLLQSAWVEFLGARVSAAHGAHHQLGWPGRVRSVLGHGVTRTRSWSNIAHHLHQHAINCVKSTLYTLALSNTTSSRLFYINTESWLCSILTSKQLTLNFFTLQTLVLSPALLFSFHSLIRRIISWV